MFATKSRVIRFCLSFALLTIMTLSGSALAFADGPVVTATITGGSLTETTATTQAPSATLAGVDQAVTYTIPITLTDLRGTGAGWNLTITSTQFTTGGGTPHLLDTSASHITGVTSAHVGTDGYTDPTNSITYAPLLVPAGTTAPTAVKFFNAALTTGLGTFTVTPTVSIALPANTFAGSYTSTVTLAVVSGP
ncbi:MAG: WxL domain-containing protein [Ktedonobacteraceae bacterium]|nr:WxL domain-containing protein [Ktedonobacteraceae bacterium]